MTVQGSIVDLFYSLICEQTPELHATSPAYRYSPVALAIASCKPKQAYSLANSYPNGESRFRIHFLGWGIRRCKLSDASYHNTFSFFFPSDRVCYTLPSPVIAIRTREPRGRFGDQTKPFLSLVREGFITSFERWITNYSILRCGVCAAKVSNSS